MRRILACLVALWLALPAYAQEPAAAATLVADEVFITRDETLIARGNVEAFQDGTRIQARQITYDRASGQLIITGPITLTQGDSTVVLADAATLDRDLQNGILTGARIVMDEQLQLAAYQMNRVNGRYSQLYKAAVTSCRVCETGRPPLWQIRARRMVHDQDEKQLYFDDAQFLVMDTPIFYLPRLRLPDPTLDRATGFLTPSIKTSSLLGTGLKVPYFIRLNDHRDLTLTPYFSQETRTLEYRYRQAFRTGDIELSGAFSQDSLRGNALRAYVFAEGTFALRRDFELRFDIEAVNDDAYLVDYGYSDKDRLDSAVSISRVRRDEYINAELTHFHSLRAGESNATLPTIVGDLTYERRLHPRFGGEVRLEAGLHSHYRYSDLSTDSADVGITPDGEPWADPDSYADGRDITRLHASAKWQNRWTLAGGLRFGAELGIEADSFHITQGGVTSAAQASQVTPSAAIELRWPLRKVTRTGAVHILEPVVQAAWVGGNRPNVPMDESTRAEFDEGNLLSLSRFAADDRKERGSAAALGLGWTRLGQDGWEHSLVLGQIIRDSAETDFSTTSGLNGRYSDVLIAGQIKTPFGLDFSARGLFDTTAGATKAEARAGWQTARANVGATYIWLGADPAENRPTTISEWALDGSYRLSRHWTGSADWRYDVATNRSVEAGLGLTYSNECVDISLSASRRFTSSTIVTPSTDFSFTVGLRGFTTRSQDDSYVRTCKN